MTKFYEFTSCLYAANNFGNLFVRILVILVALLSTVAAQFSSMDSKTKPFGVDWKNLTVFLAALTTALAAFQSAFPFADRAVVDQSLNFRVDSLLSELKMSSSPPATTDAVTAFEQIKSEAAGMPTRVAATLTPTIPSTPAPSTPVSLSPTASQGQ
jgi:hypothetical protein